MSGCALPQHSFIRPGCAYSFFLRLRTTFYQPAIGFESIKLNLVRGCGLSRPATLSYEAEIAAATHPVMLVDEKIATYAEFEGWAGGRGGIRGTF